MRVGIAVVAAAGLLLLVGKPTRADLCRVEVTGIVDGCQSFDDGWKQMLLGTTFSASFLYDPDTPGTPVSDTSVRYWWDAGSTGATGSCGPFEYDSPMGYSYAYVGGDTIRPVGSVQMVTVNPTTINTTNPSDQYEYSAVLFGFTGVGDWSLTRSLPGPSPIVSWSNGWFQLDFDQAGNRRHAGGQLTSVRLEAVPQKVPEPSGACAALVGSSVAGLLVGVRRRKQTSRQR